MADTGHVLLDPTKQEEEKMKAFVYLVFPNKPMSVLPEEQLCITGERLEHGIITSVTHGLMSVEDYLYCVERGRAATGKLSDFLRKSLQPQQPKESTAAA
ncbi:Exosome complex exonuclease RRP46-like protein [Drosera capensis]